MALSSLYVPVSPHDLFRRTPVPGFTAHSNLVWPHLTELHLQGSYFEIRSCSEVPSGYEFGGEPGRPYSVQYIKVRTFYILAVSNDSTWVIAMDYKTPTWWEIKAKEEIKERKSVTQNSAETRSTKQVFCHSQESPDEDFAVFLVAWESRGPVLFRRKHSKTRVMKANLMETSGLDHS